MSTIEIGGETQDLCSFEEHWVNQQINRRRKDGLPVHVVVRIQTSGVDLRLSTPGAGGGGGGVYRPPNQRESEIIDLWNHQRLNSADFSGGNLIAFLKQVRRGACS